MSLQRKTTEVFQRLEADQLPDDWVGRCWDTDFCEKASLPTQVCDSVLSVRTWRLVVGVVRQWLRESESRRQDDDQDGPLEPGLWTTLVDCGISHRSLLALIFSILDRKCQSMEEMESSVCAAQTYLLLLRLPAGSTAFKSFQPIIFQKALNVVYVLSGSCSGTRHGGGGGGRKGRRGGGGGRRGKKRRRRGEMMEEEEEVVVAGGGGEDGESSVMEESSMDSQFSDREKMSLLMDQFTEDLLQFMETCLPISCGEPAARDQLVQVAIHLLGHLSSGTALKPDMMIMMMTEQSGGCEVEIIGWRILRALAIGQRKDIKKTVTEVFLQLLPILLMLKGDGGAHSSTSSLPTSLTIPSSNATVFICHLVTELGDSVLTPLKGLVQQLCTKTPDKAEYRTRMATVVVKLMALFPDNIYSQLLEWLSRLARNIKVSYRVFAVEVVSELLTQPLRQPPADTLSGEEEFRLSYKYLVKMVLSRCSDKAPSVRGRALTCVAAAASSSRSDVVLALKKCIANQTATDPLVAREKESVEGLIVPMVRRRTRDQKVGVRKSAVQTLESIIKLDLSSINREDVLALHERCMDTALSVRKQALVSLSSLITDLPNCSILHELWLDGVLPMVMDKDTSAQEKCISILESIVLSNIASFHGQIDPNQKFVWELLSLVAEEDRMDLRRYVRCAMEVWAKQGKLSRSLVRAVCSHTPHPPHQKAAWALLAEMSQFVSSSFDTKFIYENWKSHSSVVTMETVSPLVHILTVVGNAAQSLARLAREDMRDEIVVMLETFNISPVVIKAAITTLSQVSFCYYILNSIYYSQSVLFGGSTVYNAVE